MRASQNILSQTKTDLTLLGDIIFQDHDVSTVSHSIVYNLTVCTLHSPVLYPTKAPYWATQPLVRRPIDVPSCRSTFLGNWKKVETECGAKRAN